MSQAMILDVTIVNVALPSIQQELHVQPANLEGRRRVHIGLRP
jgi:hypothetical protein